MSTSGNTLEAESQSPRRLIGFFSMAISLLHTGTLIPISKSVTLLNSYTPDFDSHTSYFDSQYLRFRFFWLNIPPILLIINRRSYFLQSSLLLYPFLVRFLINHTVLTSDFI
ncbi:hypothetical protein LXL04_015192 [Taraxacum kok-saghyz]